VPMIPTFVTDTIEQLIGIAPQILSQFGIGNAALPGGAPVAQIPVFQNLPTVAQPVNLPARIGTAIGGGMLGGMLGGGGNGGVTCITPTVGTTARLPSRVDVPSPDGRTFVTFRNMGRPVLWSGDFAAAKRVKRIAGRAKRRGGR